MYFPPLLAVLLAIVPAPRPAFAHPVDLSLRTRHILSQLLHAREYSAPATNVNARAVPYSQTIEARHPRAGHGIPSITLPHMLVGRAPTWSGSAGAAASKLQSQLSSQMSQMRNTLAKGQAMVSASKGNYKQADGRAKAAFS
ncbi:hypothetical protein Hypma_014800 [Hypsizygus marmoreus]|uniref:Uncharacterized protein n=1 Tax=Hypsizygus marmoreus TaxID=39966 RepID=A0A369K5N7_HYPMA|nr:hypothetical protein Hypma_014800 [Hypsizygus marmoreus]